VKRVVLAIAFSFAATAALADLSESDILQFAKDAATYDEVVAKLGEPSATQVNDEGLKAVAYLAPGAKLEGGSASIFAAFGGLAATADASRKASAPMTALIFDRTGRLLFYRAVLGGPGAKARTITSEDGAGPLPNVNAIISAQQIESSPPPADDKPHLGIQLIPVSATDEKYRHDFAAAKFDGMIVVNVLEGSAAEKAGIEKNDYLYLLNGFLVTSFDDVAKAMATVEKGATVKVRAIRIDQATSRFAEKIFVLNF